ncbi:MAG: PhzF family phenazine biosynthesis protein, partial [Solirubrobacteraceae bacterium]
TAWLLAHLGVGGEALHPPAGAVTCGAGPGDAWIEADPSWSPPWVLEQLDSAGAVDAVDAGDRTGGWEYVWAWLDEAAGVVRSRAFVREAGIDEDEATGSAALMLAAQVGRPIRIRQGRGSTIVAEPTGRGTVRISGRVVLDDDLRIDLR